MEIPAVFKDLFIWKARLIEAFDRIDNLIQLRLIAEEAVRIDTDYRVPHSAEIRVGYKQEVRTNCNLFVGTTV